MVSAVWKMETLGQYGQLIFGRNVIKQATQINLLASCTFSVDKRGEVHCIIRVFIWFCTLEAFSFLGRVRFSTDCIPAGVAQDPEEKQTTPNDPASGRSVRSVPLGGGKSEITRPDGRTPSLPPPPSLLFRKRKVSNKIKKR